MDWIAKWALGTKWGLLFFAVTIFAPLIVLIFPLPNAQTHDVVIAAVVLVMNIGIVLTNLYNLTHYCKKCGQHRYDCYWPLFCDDTGQGRL